MVNFVLGAYEQVRKVFTKDSGATDEFQDPGPPLCTCLSTFGGREGLECHSRSSHTLCGVYYCSRNLSLSRPLPHAKFYRSDSSTESRLWTPPSLNLHESVPLFTHVSGTVSSQSSPNSSVSLRPTHVVPSPSWWRSRVSLSTAYTVSFRVR